MIGMGTRQPSHPQPVSGFVLAGGQSRRMGQDKAELPWGQTTLLAHMTRLLCAVAPDPTVVGRDPFPDRDSGRGPVEGIRTALSVTATELNLIVAVDLPFLEPAFLGYLADRLRGSPADAVRCRIADRTPLCIGVRTRILSAVETYLTNGGRSLQGLLDTVPHETITPSELRALGITDRIFCNLNTPEDYETMRQ